MTPEELQQQLDQHRPHLQLPNVQAPVQLLRELENQVENIGGSATIWPLLHHAHDLLSAQEGLPPVIGTVRIETLIRWTNWSVSFDGTELHTGQAVRIRTLRASHRSAPFFKRQLFREGEQLKSSGLHTALYFSDGVWPAIVVPLSGPALEDSPTFSGHAERAIWSIRLFGTALKGLVDWDVSALHLPTLSHREMRLTETGLDIVCLTSSPDHCPNVGSVSHAILSMYGEDVSEHIEPLLHGLMDFPNSSPTDVAERLVNTLSDALAELRHDVVLQRQHGSREARLERLRHWVNRLASVQKPPAGKGALGVDLDGQTTVVSGFPGELRWGTEAHQPATIWTQEQGLAVREARRVLRTIAVAPVNTRLNRQIGGDVTYMDHVSRWLNGALELRTLVLLLDKQSG